MCVAIYKPSNVAMPSLETLKACWERNPDGAGFCILNDAENKDKYRYIIHKGYMKWKSFVDAYKQFNLADYKGPALIHFRIATHGGVTPGNTHPFPISSNIESLHWEHVYVNSVLIHNGVLSLAPRRKDISDSGELALTLGEISNLDDRIRALDLFGECLNYNNKVAVFMYDKEHDNDIILRYGEGWSCDAGVYYSNTYHKQSRYDLYSGFGGSHSVGFGSGSSSKKSSSGKKHDRYASLDSEFDDPYDSYYRDTYDDDSEYDSGWYDNYKKKQQDEEKEKRKVIGFRGDYNNLRNTKVCPKCGGIVNFNKTYTRHKLPDGMEETIPTSATFTCTKCDWVFEDRDAIYTQEYDKELERKAEAEAKKDLEDIKKKAGVTQGTALNPIEIKSVEQLEALCYGCPVCKEKHGKWSVKSFDKNKDMYFICEECNTVFVDRGGKMMKEHRMKYSSSSTASSSESTQTPTTATKVAASSNSNANVVLC